MSGMGIIQIGDALKVSLLIKFKTLFEYIGVILMMTMMKLYDRLFTIRLFVVVMKLYDRRFNKCCCMFHCTFRYDLLIAFLLKIKKYMFGSKCKILGYPDYLSTQCTTCTARNVLLAHRIRNIRYLYWSFFLWMCIKF